MIAFAELIKHTIKHFNVFDQCIIDDFQDQKLKSALAQGLPTEKNKLDELKRLGIWTNSDEQDCIMIKFELEGAQKTRKNLFTPSQIRDFDEIIKDNENKLREKI